MDVVLEYRTVPVIINDSLSKRTLKVVKLIFLVICVSASLKVNDGEVQTLDTGTIL